MDITSSLDSLLIKGYDARIEDGKIIVDLPADCVMTAEDVLKLLNDEYKSKIEVRDFVK